MWHIGSVYVLLRGCVVFCVLYLLIDMYRTVWGAETKFEPYLSFGTQAVYIY